MVFVLPGQAAGRGKSQFGNEIDEAARSENGGGRGAHGRYSFAGKAQAFVISGAKGVQFDGM